MPSQDVIVPSTQLSCIVQGAQGEEMQGTSLGLGRWFVSLLQWVKAAFTEPAIGAFS